MKETGEIEFANQKVTYADGGEDTVYDHIKTILDFSTRQTSSYAT
ncbi:MAG TPA: hypothetical protein VJZ04_07365 [Lachnospiraceae bacterium]|nr:hypothetical protein [Lachnospiraceae bacterium]